VIALFKQLVLLCTRNQSFAAFIRLTMGRNYFTVKHTTWNILTPSHKFGYSAELVQGRYSLDISYFERWKLNGHHGVLIPRWVWIILWLLLKMANFMTAWFT